MKDIKKLLIIRLSALGDVFMTLPVIESFCRKYPDVEVTFLTNNMGADVAQSIIKLPNFSVKRFAKSKYKGIKGLVSLYNELKSYNFDAVADFHNVIRTIFLDFCFRLNGKKVAEIDKGRQEKKNLISHTGFRQLETSINRYKKVLDSLGFSFTIDYDARSVSELFKKTDEDQAAISVGIAPFAQHKGKVYPVELMQSVIDLLISKHPECKVYLFGGPNEAEELNKWQEARKQNVVNLAGKQSIIEDLALMLRLNVLVSMDSANMHLASLVGTRCVSVWGATHIFAGFLGFGQKEADCIQKDLSCRPCSIYGDKPCKFGNYKCLSEIDPSLIVSKIEQCL